MSWTKVRQHLPSPEPHQYCQHLPNGQCRASLVWMHQWRVQLWKDNNYLNGQLTPSWRYFKSKQNELYKYIYSNNLNINLQTNIDRKNSAVWIKKDMVKSKLRILNYVQGCTSAYLKVVKSFICQMALSRGKLPNEHRYKSKSLCRCGAQ